jgi:hypothetical protein
MSNVLYVNAAERLQDLLQEADDVLLKRNHVLIQDGLKVAARSTEE